MMLRHVLSKEGMLHLEQRESLRLQSYRDTRGVLTIGWGHTSAAGSPIVHVGMHITRAEADTIFKHDLLQYEQAVNKVCPMNVTQNEYDALVSFCYNIGTGGFNHSMVAHYLSSGNITLPMAHKIAKAMLEWDKPPELIGRREGEVKQFLTPYTAEEEKNNAS